MLATISSWALLAAVVSAPAPAWCSAPPTGLAALRSYGQLYVGPAPDAAALREFKDRQGGVVIDLRSFKDMDCGARASATKLGVPYRNVPLESDPGADSELSAEAFEKIEDAIAAAGSKPVMLVCKTGNRAAAAAAFHLARVEHLSPSQTLERARSLGLTSRELTATFRRFLLHSFNKGDQS